MSVTPIRGPHHLAGGDASDVRVPDYDPAALTPAVVHLGAGGFHRAHQAVYFDDLACRGVHDWGVIDVSVRSRGLAEALTAQNNLFTVVERDGDASSARVVGCVQQVLVLADDPDAVRRRLADPTTRLVTLTVTGDGYRTDEDAVRDGDSVFATLAAALDDRRRAGAPPFTVLSCDNLPDSGAAARRATLAFAAACGPGFADWVAREVSFPASMVDRITPQTHEEHRAWIAERYAVTDLAPVVTEAFAQWFIEDDFSNGRPPLDTVGVRFVEDVHPYKNVKSRMLNGVHCALGYLGHLAGFRSTDEAMRDADLATYVQRLTAEEIAPLLPADLPGMELDEYRSTLLQRLRNPAIADPLDRLCRRGTTKMADYLLPSLLEARAAGLPHELLMLAVAGWLRYLRGVDLDGVPIDIVDPHRDLILAAAELPLEEGTRRLLSLPDVVGELGRDAELVDELTRLTLALDATGVAGTIDDLTGLPLTS